MGTGPCIGCSVGACEATGRAALLPPAADAGGRLNFGFLGLRGCRSGKRARAGQGGEGGTAGSQEKQA